MYLTKIVINRLNREVALHYKDVDWWHKNIMSGFNYTGYEGRDTRKHHKALFRQIEDVIYIQSETKPKYTNENWIKSIVVKDISDFIKNMEDGRVYQFDICVLPYTRDRESIKKEPQLLKDDEAKLEWFRTKANLHGFRILDCVKDMYSNIELQNIGGKDYTVTATRFLGRLVVTDAERFKTFYSVGIGRGKAYGAGMILLH